MARKLYEYMSPEAAHVQITESQDGKELFMAGLFIQGDVQNQNGRVYPKDEIERAVESVNARLGKGETVLGELDHPEELQINLDRVSHIITDMRCDGANGMGKLKIIDTPMGNIARSLLKAGAKLGVSSRGSGNVNESGKVSDFDIVTVDIVAQPSAPDAYPKTIYESLFNMRGGAVIFDTAVAMTHDKNAEKQLMKQITSFINELKKQETTMAGTFNELLEGVNLSEDAKVAIQEAWEGRLAEAREELTAELREEFSQRYEHDKGLIVEAMDNFISTKVEAEIQELAEDKKSLSEQQVKYRKAISEHAKLLDKFVTEMVAKEVQELRADRNRVAEHVGKLDEFVSEQLAEELKEFHEDKKALVEQKVKMVREGKRQLAEAKTNFIQKAAKTVEGTINKVISEEVKSFRDDITAARENDFGRRIFEAFATEYNTSYLNEAKEIHAVQKRMSEMEKALNEAKAQVAQRDEAKKLVESKLRVAEDRYARNEKLNSLLAPLGKEKKAIMQDLLESVKTENLEKQFDKYLPSVLDGETLRAKKALTESVVKEHTGNKQAPAKAEAIDNTDSVVEIDTIRKLAGLSK